jgi:hypothetical protein
MNFIYFVFMKSSLGRYLFFVLLLNACSKTNSSNNTPIIYVGGFTGILGNNNESVIWKNGSAISFPNTYGMTSICVSGTDLYGCSGNIFWKNGVATTQADMYLSNHIAASGNDVYITGYSQTTYNTGAPAAEYWKNGTLINLTQNVPNLVSAGTSGVAVSGNDVYICGTVSTGPLDTMNAVYWKNGQINYLPDGISTSCIAVSGSDIYVGGSSVHNGDVYWKNGILQSLGNVSGNIFAWINAIAVSGPDVYIGGYTNYSSYQGVYWKNGQLVAQLPGCNMVNGIAVSGSTVYCSGKTNTNNAAYWINNVSNSLGVGQSSCIAVGQ